MIFQSHEAYINEKLQKYFNQGWEVAGDAYVKYHDSPISAVFIYIPLKRLLK